MKKKAEPKVEPRWPAVVALLTVAGLRFLLPRELAIGPSWLLLVVVLALLFPTITTHMRGEHGVNMVLGHVLTSAVTLDMAWSLSRLISALPRHAVPSGTLLVSAAVLWVTNILVFASWYWRLDAGGLREREIRGVHSDGDFLFPQMTLDDDSKNAMGEREWTPGFVDYLFVAFNTSTAFSPTDTPVLSRWAKALCMVQSMISFATVVLLAARAVNIL